MSDRGDRQTDAEESEEEEDDTPATQADEDFAWLELRQVGGGGRFSFADASTCKIGSSRSNRAMDLQLDVRLFCSTRLASPPWRMVGAGEGCTARGGARQWWPRRILRLTFSGPAWLS